MCTPVFRCMCLLRCMCLFVCVCARVQTKDQLQDLPLRCHLPLSITQNPRDPMFLCFSWLQIRSSWQELFITRTFIMSFPRTELRSSCLRREYVNWPSYFCCMYLFTYCFLFFSFIYVKKIFFESTIQVYSRIWFLSLSIFPSLSPIPFTFSSKAIFTVMSFGCACVLLRSTKVVWVVTGVEMTRGWQVNRWSQNLK